MLYCASNVIVLVRRCSIASRVEVCIVSGCLHHRRTHAPVPMRRRRLDNLAIWRNIGNRVLFFDDWGWFRSRILLLLPPVQVVVLESSVRKSRFLCRVWGVSHGRRCGFSMRLVAVIDRLMGPEPLWFWRVLLVLVTSFCDRWSSGFVNLAILDRPSWMG